MKRDQVKKYLGVMKSKDLDNVTFESYNGVLCENVIAHYWNVYVWLYLCWSDFLSGPIIIFMIPKVCIIGVAQLSNALLSCLFNYNTNFIFIFLMLWISLSSYYNYLTITNHVFWFLFIQLGLSKLTWCTKYLLVVMFASFLMN
jgi:hypothetical protein